MEAIKQLEELVKSLKSEIKAVKNDKELQDLKIKYTGRKSELNTILRSIKNLPKEEKSVIGKESNKTKIQIEEILARKEIDLQKQEEKEILEEKIDLTFPGKKTPLGNLHPITQMYNKVVRVFRELGFTIVEGPDIETDWHCFEMLRMQKDHPARDMQDTYYIEEGEVLPRTHTSAVQIRTLMNQKPPIKILAPGRCYRNEKPDPRHTETFYQFEGLVIDEKTSLKDLKSTLTSAFRRLLENDDVKLRFRHNHFPYTEPSIEVDGTCVMCGGKGCRTCGGDGWVELCGAGQVHPEVLENFGINSDKYQGYAFGPGIGRFVMLRHQVPDTRLLFENDLRTLEQF